MARLNIYQLELEKEDNTIRKQAHRKALKDSGLLNVPSHKVHKDKKQYDRKKSKSYDLD